MIEHQGWCAGSKLAVLVLIEETSWSHKWFRLLNRGQILSIDG